MEEAERSPTENSDRIELEPDLAPGMEPEEGDPTRRFVKKQGALQQGTNIPVGWKPTARKPIPVVRCNHIFKDDHPRGGDRCGRWSLRGSQLCYIHSGRGNLRNVEEYRQAILEAARLRLTEAVPDALDGLINLSANSPADNVRLKAYTEILDRAGIKTAQELNVNLEVSEANNPATVLAERMEKLRKAAELAQEMQRRNEEAQREALALEQGTAVIDTDGEIIDGEVVEDESSTADTADGG